MLNKKEYPYNLLTDYFITENNITEHTQYEIFEVDARELLVPNRIDLIVKYYYIDCKYRNINLEYAKKLYSDHIEAFSAGRFEEPGSPEKNSIEVYLNDFDNLITDIKKNGFDSRISLVPLGDNNEILDGSHRVSCAAYFNKKVTVIKFKGLKRKFNYEFFRDRLLDRNSLDFIMLNYSLLKSDLYLACIWPRA